MKIVKWLIDSNIWISFGAIGLSSVAFSIIEKEYNWNVGGLLFFATLFTYNGLALLKSRSLEKRGIKQESKKRIFVCYTPLAFLEKRRLLET